MIFYRGVLSTCPLLEIFPFSECPLSEGSSPTKTMGNQNSHFNKINSVLSFCQTGHHSTPSPSAPSHPPPPPPPVKPCLALTNTKKATMDAIRMIFQWSLVQSLHLALICEFNRLAYRRDTHTHTYSLHKGLGGERTYFITPYTNSV